MATTTATTNFNQTVTALIQKTLEQELRPSLVHLADGNVVKASFVKGTNNTMRYLRVPDLSIDINSGTTTAGVQPWLTEGSAPAAEALAFGYEEFSAYQAGRRIEITDKAAMQSPLDLAGLAAEKVALNGAQTAEAFAAYVFAQGTNRIYSGTSNTALNEVAAGDVITVTNLRQAVRTLKRDDVPAFGDGFYRAIIEPGVVYDLEIDTATGAWLDASRYAGSGPLLTGEFGRFAGIRFMESSMAYVHVGAGTTAIDVYSTLIFGPDAFAFGDWGTITGHFVAPGGHGDELAQVASIGWKGYFGAVILDEAGPRYLSIKSASGL